MQISVYKASALTKKNQEVINSLLNFLNVSRIFNKSSSAVNLKQDKGETKKGNQITLF